MAAEDEAHEPPDDVRTTYQPASSKRQVRQQFRPTSAPRVARSLAHPDRPTSAPISASLDSGLEGADGSAYALGGINEMPVGDGYYGGAHAYRPTSAPSRPLHLQHISESGLAWQPLSYGMHHPRLAARKDRATRLEESGAMRFVDDVSFKPPVRIFSPMASPQTHKTRFQPKWALSNHRQRERDAISDATLESALSYEGSRLSSMGVQRPRSANSSFVSAAGSAARSTVSALRRAGSAGPYTEIPRTAIRNPLAQRIGGSTGDLVEVNGAFEPLKSQCQLPTYDALYDPHLRPFWSRNDVAKVMKLEGKTRDLWAPDSGMLEATISAELTELRRSRDIAELTAPLDPLVSALGVDPVDPWLPKSEVMTIEVSEEAVSLAQDVLPLSLRQPVVSVWLHWGCQSGHDTAADLDLSAVCFDDKARVIETVFYRHLISRHEALVHLGDDSDDTVSPAELVTNPLTAPDDVAAGMRRKEGIIVHLPRVRTDVTAIAFAVTCYTDEVGLSEAAGAEVRMCVGPTHSTVGLDNDLLHYVLSSERYKAAAPCLLVRDPAAESGWCVHTRPRVCLANVVLEMIPVLQAMVRTTNVCKPYELHIEYCTARRPTSSLRGKRSDYTNSFKAVAVAVRRAFPFVIVKGNPMSPAEKPRIGAFECAFVDAGRGVSQLLFSKIKTGKWPASMDVVLRRIAEEMTRVQVSYQLPDDKSDVEVAVVDAGSGQAVPWAVVEVHALGLAAQKLLITDPSTTLKSATGGDGGKRRMRSKKSRVREGDEVPGKRLYRVQTNAKGVLRMRLPGGRYEVWGISQGFDCEYPLEMHVRPFSKYKFNARLALRRLGAGQGAEEGDSGGGGGERGTGVATPRVKADGGTESDVESARGEGIILN
jgi:stress response protein SCP2